MTDHTLESDRLKRLIETLQLAHSMGFSSNSSAVEILLEVAIDTTLQISSLLKEGSLGRRNNKEIRFLDDEVQDELGNSRQISFAKKRKFYWEPEAEDLLRQFTSFLVLLKHQSPLPSSLIEQGKRGLMNFNKPTTVGRTKNKKVRELHQTKIRKVNDSYYRRQRNKRSQ
jgi:hypothetical protein